MNPKAIVAAVIFSVAALSRAEEARPGSATPTPAQAATKPNRNPGPLNNLISGNPQSAGEPAGADHLLPDQRFIEAFRLHRYSADRSLGRRLLDLPVIRLLVPQRMPSPPGGTGHYFAWGASSRPWASIAAGAAPGEGFTSSVNNKPHSGLILRDW